MFVKTEERVELFIHIDIIRSKNNENYITGRKAGTEGELLATGARFDCSSPRGTLQTWALTTSSPETLKTQPDNEKCCYFYRIFPYCWWMIPKPPGDTCSRALEQWQRWPAAPKTPVLCPPVSLGRDLHSKITTAIQCITRWAEISSHHWCIFQTANSLLVIS